MPDRPDGTSRRHTLGALSAGLLMMMTQPGQSETVEHVDLADPRDQYPKPPFPPQRQD
jgi:hypothetical protein